MAYYSVHESDYPYARASRGVSRSVFIAAIFAAIVFALWSGVTTFYLAFRDDALRAIVSRQISVSRAYDAQVANLEAELEKIRSTKLIDQQRIERTVAELTRMQRVIEARHGALAALAKTISASDVVGAVPAAEPPSPAPAESKPRPLSELRVNPPDQRVRPPAENDPLAREIVAIGTTLTRLNATQSGTLNALEFQLDGRITRARKILKELGGTNTAAVANAAPAGGPLIPVGGLPHDPFARQIFRVRQMQHEYVRLSRQFEGLPILPPLVGQAEVTSGFGSRIDPFLRQLAMHSGVDLRGETGDPVRAAASGTVIAAERHAAYGLMVDVDHGNGIVSRYAHLSAISVKEGQFVPAGAVLGRVGSTGRSTGPHLHFEVRIDGDAVDPQRYLRAGLRLTEASQ